MPLRKSGPQRPGSCNGCGLSSWPRCTPVERRLADIHGQRRPREVYTVKAYHYAIRRACQRAEAANIKSYMKAHGLAVPPDPIPTQLLVPHWHPHQLRHNAATWLRKEFGLDVARIILGHRSPAITEVYAELDFAKAVEVMHRVG